MLIHNAVITGSLVLPSSLPVTGSLLISGSVTATAFIPSGATIPTNGIYLSAANTLDFATNTTNRLTITSAGNVGINTTSPAYTLDVSGTLKISGLFTSTAFGSNSFSAGGTGYNKLTIRNTTDGAANSAQLSIGSNADPDQFYVQSFATTFTTSGMNIAGGAVINGEGPGGLSIAATQSNIGFYTNGAAAGNLRMTITSAGNVGIGTISPSAKLYVINSSTTQSSYYAETSSASYTGSIMTNLCFTAASTSWNHFIGYSSIGSTTDIKILGNGNIQNANNSYGSLSDIKLKENIIDASPKLNKLIKVKIRNYNLIGSEIKQIGVIAQELEEIFPSMIEETEDFKQIVVTDEEGNVTKENQSLGTTTKSVKYSVFVPMLIKAIQEQQVQIETQDAKIEELKALIAAK